MMPEEEVSETTDTFAYWFETTIVRTLEVEPEDVIGWRVELGGLTGRGEPT